MPIEFLTPAPGARPGPGTLPATVPGSGFSLNLWGKDGFTFSDLLDFINPLQHIPVVSTLYRSFTGDEIGNAARIVGGAAIGGIGGLVSSLIDTVVEGATGKDIGSHILALVKDGEPKTGWQLAEDDGDGIENVDYENAPETILVAEDDTTIDQDIAAARAAVAAENVADAAAPSTGPANPANNAVATNGAAPKGSKIPATPATGIPARTPVVSHPRQAGSTPLATPSLMAPSPMAMGVFTGGTTLPAGSALYAAKPANAAAALMATAKPNPGSHAGPNPMAQTVVGSPFSAAVANASAMPAQGTGQPFWLGLMAENAEKAAVKSQNKSQNKIGAAAQHGKTLDQYRETARFIMAPAPAVRIYR